MEFLPAPRVTLYGMDISAGTRLAEWAASCAEVPYDKVTIDLFSDEHKTNHFRAITEDRHCIPAMAHGARRMTESRAIAAYLLRGADGIGTAPSAFAHGASEWVRAKISELIQYDATCLYKRVSAFAYPNLFGMGKAPENDGEEAEQLRKSLRLLEDRLGGHRSTPGNAYLVCAKPTIADLVVANTLSLLLAVPARVVKLDVSFPLVAAWLDRMATFGGYKNIVKPFEEFAQEKMAKKM